LNDDGFPGPKRLPPVGNPCRARVDPGAPCARFDRRRPFARRVASLRASPTWTLSAATENAHTDTGVTNRLLQPSKSMGTPTGRRVLRTEPAVSARSAARRWPELRMARPPELTPRTPEGKVATGRQRDESACATDRAEAHSPQCRAPLRHSLHAPSRSGRLEASETANAGLTRSAARTVRTFDRPRCFPSPGILTGADPATIVHARHVPEGNAPPRPTPFAPLTAGSPRLAGQTMSNGGQHRPELAGHQLEACRTAAPRTTST
jgi:hypothetical protein